MNLALKYRPQSLEDVVGQCQSIAILKSQIKSNELQNGYLFVGASGCGKTTTARILAKEINGNTGGTIELDGASNNGVDDVRELIELSKTNMIGANKRIFIIDECHAFSKQAWQSLLKLIEEPPKHVVIILCTTEIKKVPETILSRVMSLEFRKFDEGTIEERLRYVADIENIKVDTIDYMNIAKASKGNMRMALSTLEKYKYLANVADYLNYIPQKRKIEFFNMLLGNKLDLDILSMLFTDYDVELIIDTGIEYMLNLLFFGLKETKDNQKRYLKVFVELKEQIKYMTMVKDYVIAKLILESGSL